MARLPPPLGAPENTDTKIMRPSLGQAEAEAKRLRPSQAGADSREAEPKRNRVAE